MIRTLENGFKIAPGSDGVDRLLFDSSHSKECIEFAFEYDYKRIMLNPFHGFSSDNLDDLLPLKDFIEGLIIGSEKIKYEKLHLFSQLNLLGVPDNGKDIVQLYYFPNLSVLNCSVNNRLQGLEACSKLKCLTVSKYKPHSKDLSAFPTLPQLENLSFIMTDIISLKGIEMFKILDKLEIFKASNLVTIMHLASLSNSLIEIQIEKCKKIIDFEILGKLKMLEKMILSESGQIKSLSFIQELHKLKFISFWGTNILDGNINYCEGIDFVGFDNKKHYNLKSKYFRKE